ncbi:MAG: GNAT family N-acetyltransferase [Candidatus Sericytochromatia bacterium]
MEEIIIKKVTLIKDLEIISYLGKKTFKDTFEHETTKEEMDSYLNEAFSLDKLQKEFENHNSIFFISYFNDIPVGYAKINLKKKPNIIKEATEDLSALDLEKFVELQRIYILKDYQGKKIAHIFMDYLINLVKNSNFKYFWLGVSDRNIRAVKFYSKYDFYTIGKHIFKIADKEDIDLIMIKNFL